MKTARKPSGVLKQNYDKIILVAVLVALLVSAGLLLAKLQQGANIVENTRSGLEASSPKIAEPIDTESLETLSQTISDPYQLDPDINMLVGEKRVSSIPDGLPIPYGAEVCPFTQTPQPEMVSAADLDTDRDGIPDVWEQKYKMNPYDASDARLDADGDDFSNFEEYSADTSPIDAASAPPPAAKLRLVGIEVIPFKLLFKGVSEFADGSLRYQLNLLSGDRTHWARMGQEIEGFTVTGYNPDGPRGPELVLLRGDREIVLVQGRAVSETARRAAMRWLVDGSRYEAGKNETISLKGIDYKVVDIRDDRVVIRDEATGRDIDVRRMSSDERDALSGAGPVRPGPGGPGGMR